MNSDNKLSIIVFLDNEYPPISEIKSSEASKFLDKIYRPILLKFFSFDLNGFSFGLGVFLLFLVEEDFFFFF